MNIIIEEKGARVSVYEDPFNKRIRIDDYAGPLTQVMTLIRRQTPGWIEKIIVKSRSGDLPFFIAQGFCCEAFIRGYFDGADMFFAVMYREAGREVSLKWHEEQLILKNIISSQKDVSSEPGPVLMIATQSDAKELAELYAAVFKLYPTPVGEPQHILKTIVEGTLYAYIREEGKIVSAASAEINKSFLNAELTDCASLDRVQGKGHMKKLLSFLEQQLTMQGIRCLYSIARAESPGMNKAFYQLKYTYGGRLINNCYIWSGLEDMNVWYKVYYD